MEHIEEKHQGDVWLLLNSQLVDMHRQLNNIQKDRDAVHSFLEEHVANHTYPFNSLAGQLQFMVAEGYYEREFLAKYTFEQIEAIFTYAKKHFRGFKSFTAVTKAYQEYLVKERASGRYLESFSDRLSIVALYHADGDFSLAQMMIQRLIAQDFIPATPTLLNTGRKQRGEFVSCFLLEMGDSLNDINRTIDFAGQLSKVGGGVAINFSNIRARGESVNGYEGASKGILPLAKIFDVLFRYVDQQGQRPGAGVIYLPVFHADILEFLSAKKINTDQDSRLTTLSIGVIMPNKFIELFKAKEPIYLFYPHSITLEYGVPFSEVVAHMDEWYDRLVNNTHIKKRLVEPALVMETMVQSWSQSGYPYLFFIDNANAVNMIPGSIKQSNLCTEIMQVATLSHYGFYHEKEDSVGMDITCTLSSGHVESMMEHDSIRDTLYSAMQLMSHVTQKSAMAHVPSIHEGNAKLHSVGFGMMGLHGFLVKHNMEYGSEETLNFVDCFFNAVNYWSLRASCDLAKKWGAFDGFADSGYADGRYFVDRGAIYPRYPQVKELFAPITSLPSDEDWQNLAQEVKEFGLYNAYRLAIAPTGSIAYIMSATPSVTPVKNIIEERVYSRSRTFYPAPHLDKEGCLERYASAYDIKKKQIIDTLAVIQKHVDQGISFEVCVHSSYFRATDLVNTMLYAHAKGLKSMYYIRINKAQLEECLVCQI